MKPPIKVSVATNNLDWCELRIAGADGVAHAIRVPSHGNVYQGLHAVTGELELLFADILAAHGIYPPEPPSEQPPAVTMPEPPIAMEPEAKPESAPAPTSKWPESNPGPEILDEQPEGDPEP